LSTGEAIGGVGWLERGQDQPMPPALRELIDLQDGVVARRQALAAGMTEGRIRSLLRRRAWVVVHPGVYVTHTGELSWQQRAWVAVLSCWPAGLAARSALRSVEGPGRRDLRDEIIQVAVARNRSLSPPPGTELIRTDRIETVQWHRYPPRMPYELAVVMVADEARTDLQAIGWLAEAVGGRRTTGERLRKALVEFPRLHRRELLDRTLEDVVAGTCSVLEQAYRERVERAHGLPRATLQAPGRGRDGRAMWRDALYEELRLVVELDGRLFHDTARARDRDMERDLDAALDGLATVRLGYGQVMDRACATAPKLAELMTARGWTGRMTRCGNCVDSLSP
jgi:hypothetical protein